MPRPTANSSLVGENLRAELNTRFEETYNYSEELTGMLLTGPGGTPNGNSGASQTINMASQRSGVVYRATLTANTAFTVLGPFIPGAMLIMAFTQGSGGNWEPTMSVTGGSVTFAGAGFNAAAPAGTNLVYVFYAISTTELWQDAQRTTLTQSGAPSNTALPTINDSTPTVGQSLTATLGSWSGSPTSYDYVWQENISGTWTAISGTSGTTSDGTLAVAYSVASSNTGRQLRFSVTATNASGVSPAVTSAATSAVASLAVPVNTGLPTITGTAQVGQTLTASNGTWNDPSASFAHQWQRNASGTFADISGATSTTYALTSADAGATVRVRVVATNAGGPSSPAASAPTAVVTTVPLVDNFTGADGTLLTAHTADTGATWAKHALYTGNAQIIANRLIASVAGTGAQYMSSITPGSNVYAIEAQVFIVASPTGTNQLSVGARYSTTVDTGYDWYIDSNEITLMKVVAGSHTQLATAAATWTQGQTYTIRFEVGTTKRVLVDGAVVLSSTDNTITTAGNVMVYTDSTEIALDQLQVLDMTDTSQQTLPAASGSLFEVLDYEAGTFGDWTTSGGGMDGVPTGNPSSGYFQVVANPDTASPTMAFTKVFKAIVDSAATVGGAAGERTAVYLFPNDSGSRPFGQLGRSHAYQGATTWYRTWVRFPAGSAFNPVPNSSFNWVFEIHNWPNGPCCAHVSVGVVTNTEDGGATSTTGRLSFRTLGGGSIASPLTGGENFNASPTGLGSSPRNPSHKRWIQGPAIVRDHWYEILVGMTFQAATSSTTATGSAQYWVDGVQYGSTLTGIPTLYYYADDSSNLAGTTAGTGQGYLFIGNYRDVGQPASYLYHGPVLVGSSRAAVLA